MPSWKKIIVSGSSAVLNQVTSSGGFSGDGSGITNVAYTNISDKPTLVSGSSQIATEISGAFTEASSSFSTRLTTAETELGNELISGSSQIATEISGAFTDASSSLASRVSTNEGYLNQSVKTDATPTFAGLTSTSDVVIQGKLTAETYAVSSSVTHMTRSFSSGSTIFGDTPSDDTHQFTGSLFVTSSALTIDSAGTVSGSSTSTGSFGVIEVDGGHFTSASLASGGSGVSSYDDLTDVPVGLVSGSAQIDHDATTNFVADEHFTQSSITTVGTVTSGNVTAILPAGTVSGSGQISTEISGAFGNTSSSIASRFDTLEGTGTIQGVGQSDNVTFNKITTTGPDTFGGNVTIAGNLTLQGSQSAAETLVIADQFGFFASGSESSPVDAGILVQSGSSAMTGSALYNDVNVDANKNPNGGRWSVAKDVKADDTSATPTAYVGTVTVGGDASEPEDGDVKYGVGEMYITSDGEIYIYTGS